MRRIAGRPATIQGDAHVSILHSRQLDGAGIKAIKASPKRVRATKRLAKDCGLKFRNFHMTLGQYDAIAIVEAPNDETVARFALALGSAGNVRTTTLKGFTEQEHRKIIGSLP